MGSSSKGSFNGTRGFPWNNLTLCAESPPELYPLLTSTHGTTLQLFMDNKWPFILILNYKWHHSQPILNMTNSQKERLPLLDAKAKYADIKDDDQAKR